MVTVSRTSSRTSGLPPTLADVAERAGVSRQTVSNAVNNPDLLRADTLLRVQQAIADLGYLPNRAARNLRTRASHLIGLRIQAAQEGTANATMDRFVHSLVETSREAGYHVLLFTGDPTDPLSGYEDLLRSTAVDAFVVTDTYLGNPQAEWLDGRRAPFVAFGRPWENSEATHAWVDVDGAAGCESATRHLLAKGLEVGEGVEGPAGQHRLALPALRGPELLLDRGARVLGEATGEPGAEGRAARVVVDDVRRRPGARDPLELGEAGLAAGSEEVGPARVHHVDAGVGQRQVLGGALEHRDLPVGRQPPGAAPGDGAQVGVRLDTGHRRRGAREAGQVEAGAAADVEDVAVGPATELLDHGLDAPVGVEGVVLELVGVGVVPDVGAGAGALRQHRRLPQSRTRPPGVWICTAITPGVPCGATQSTLTSSRGASTGSPSHSLTRSGSPAISRQARA